MKGHINEIAGIINECFYYYNRICYQAKILYSIDASFLKLKSDTYKQFQKTNRQQTVFINKCKLRQAKTKPLVTQLILDLNHIYKFAIFSNQVHPLINGGFVRLKNGKPKNVNTLKNAVIFFRDAICHPEHTIKEPTPRALPRLPHVNPTAYFYLIKHKKDFYIQIGEGKIYLKADILKCLKKLKERCLKYDHKNILKNFKWIK